MLRISRGSVAFVAALMFVPTLWAQELPQPGPEHKKLKELEGTWDATMKMGDQESKGTMVWKMDLGGLWLVSEFEGDFGGMKFMGKGMDSYDPIKKKYVSVWVDSMSTLPVVAEGNFDKNGKTMTMTGEGPGPDGKPTKYKMTTEHKDKDNLLWSLYGAGPDGKEGLQFTITYKRRK
jgi:hypothetical protein